MAASKFQHVADAKRYAQRVVDGKISACKWVKAACQRQLVDLAREKEPRWPYRFDKAAAEKVCRAIELMPHVKGPLAKAGEKIRLEPWQRFILTTVFGWVKKSDGKRRFRRSYIEVPRGSAKSTLSSAVGLYMLALDGETGADCYSAAVKADQAKIVFGDAQAMARKSPGFCERFGVAVGAHNINVLSTNSKFEALSGDDKGLDGLNIHFACVDELHKHKTRAVFDVIETGAGKRDQSLIWIITTAGSDRAGVCYELRTDLTKILEGVYRDEASFGIIYTIDEGDEWSTDAALEKANPNWGVSVEPEYVIGLREKAKRVASATNNFLTKHLNVWVSADAAYFSVDEWNRCGDPALRIEDFEGEPCWVPIDLADRRDIAAKMKLFRRDGIYYVFGGYYLPEEEVERAENAHYQGWVRGGWITATDGNTTDFSRIEDDLGEDASHYEIREVPYDPFQATQFAQRMSAAGFPMVEMRPIVKNFSEPMKFLDALIADRKIRHNGDPVLSWMISNVVAHRDAKDNVFPRKERDENKIDGVVALIMGLGRAMVEAGPEVSVYESRGVLTY